MLVYRFTAHTRGQFLQGEVVALSPGQATARLAGLDDSLELDTLRLDLKATLRTLNDRWFPVSGQDLATFFRQLHVLFMSGMELSRSLRTLAESSANTRIREALFEMDRGLHEGNYMSDMMRKFPSLFNPFLCGLVAVGERTGAFQDVLDRAATLLEKDADRVRRVQSALVYPAFLAVVSVAVMACMVLFFLPKMAEVLQSLGSDLNPALQVMLFVGRMLADGTVVGIVVMLSLTCLLIFLMWLSTPDGLDWRDRLLLKIPVLRKVFLALALSRFSFALCLVLRCGMPLSHAMEVLSTTVGNRVVARSIQDARERLINGETLAEALEWEGAFRGLFLHMVQVGEESSRLEALMDHVQRIYTEELDIMLDIATQLIEPIILILMGTMVGAMVITFMLPIAHMVSKL
ncbi:MAG: type II secretion system F family protein [Candidatus Eremiobacterota bacterium]